MPVEIPGGSLAATNHRRARNRPFCVLRGMYQHSEKEIGSKISAVDLTFVNSGVCFRATSAALPGEARGTVTLSRVVWALSLRAQRSAAWVCMRGRARHRRALRASLKRERKRGSDR